jgi:sulfonate transport system permease protein
MYSRTRLQHLAAQWIVPIVLVAAWQLLVQYGLISRRVLPAPSEVIAAGARLVASGELLTHIEVSALRAWTGFFIGAAAGLCLGILTGSLPAAEMLLDSTLQMIRNVPHLAVIPLVVLWFGIGEKARIVMVVLGVFFPVYLNTFHGVRSADPHLVEMGRVYGLSRLSIFRHVVLPGAMPSILIGVRYALGIMWLTLIVAESVAATSGIGYLAMTAREFMQTDVVLLTIVLYALLGKMSDSITRLLERWLLRWRPT